MKKLCDDNRRIYDIRQSFATSVHRIPVSLKIFGGLSMVAGGCLAILLALLVVGMGFLIYNGMLEGKLSTVTLVIFIVETVLMTLLAGMFAVFGIRLLLNKRRHAALLENTMITVLVGVVLCDIMLSGFSVNLIPYAIIAIFLIAVQSYLDPSLAEERELHRRLRDMEIRNAAQDGTLGRDKTGKGFIALNFFNLFWIFTVCCVLGLIIESIYHITVVDPGHFENRAGMLFGPFSPIYGFGAVLMTIALNRFHSSNIVIIFFISAAIGGAFEYLTSWFMQFAFGIVAWDYSGTFLSIDGRTNFMFMCMWGVLGVVWIKVFLPWMLKFVNLIPWNWRYAITTLCAVLMIADGAMTLLALDCWYQRSAGTSVIDSAILEFFDENFNNEYMETHFQSMSIDPDNATRPN